MSRKRQRRKMDRYNIAPSRTAIVFMDRAWSACRPQ